MGSTVHDWGWPRNGPFWTKNGSTWQACQRSKVVLKGPKWPTHVFLTIWDPLGPIWTLLDHFRPKLIFYRKWTTLGLAEVLRSKKTLTYQDNHHHHNFHQLSFTMPPHCSHGRYLNHQRTQKRTLAALKVALPGLGSYLRGNRSLLTAHRAPCAENAIINVKVIGASQEMLSLIHI